MVDALPNKVLQLTPWAVPLRAVVPFWRRCSALRSLRLGAHGAAEHRIR